MSRFDCLILNTIVRYVLVNTVCYVIQFDMKYYIFLIYSLFVLFPVKILNAVLQVLYN